METSSGVRVVAGPPGRAERRPARRPPPGRRPGLAVGCLAVGCLAVPFGIALVRILAFRGRVFLPDDLALIDLHTRVALHWHQAVGPFDRFGWNHPGPAYFYLLSVSYRILGSGARAEFFGATVVNAAAALGVVWTVGRRAGPVGALWASVCVGALSLSLSVAGGAAVTYSEGPLGALVSPWNPVVVVLPTLLVVVLGAAATAGSPLSLLGAVLVGSVVVQTDFSAAPLIVAVLVAAALVMGADRVGRRRTPAVPPPGPPVSSPPPPDGRPGRRPRRAALVVLGSVLVVAMWVPPVVQQLRGHPGNMTRMARFFTAPHPMHSVANALWAVASTMGALVLGPSEVMRGVLGRTSHHVGVALVATVVALAAGVLALVLGRRTANRFGAALGAASLWGLLVTAVAITEITGLIYGYLVLWAVTLPVAALIGVGVVLLGRPAAVPGGGGGRPPRPLPVARVAVLCVLALVVAGALSVRVLRAPSLRAVSDTGVSASAALVGPALDHRLGPVFVGDDGLDLLQTETFIGLVNRLDELGYRPKVNWFWKPQFGPGYQSDGNERTQVALYRWSPPAAALPGYRGRAGGIAVVVNHVPPRLDLP